MKLFKSKLAVCLSLALLSIVASVYGKDEKQVEQFVFVGGEVKSPGPKVLTNGMVTLDAIRMAKGVTDQASLTNIMVVRNQKSTTQSIILNRQEIESGKKPDLKLLEGDRIIILHK